MTNIATANPRPKPRPLMTLVKFLMPGATRIEVLVGSVSGLGAEYEFKLELELELSVGG
jgi:hypothetical protein